MTTNVIPFPGPVPVPHVTPAARLRAISMKQAAARNGLDWETQALNAATMWESFPDNYPASHHYIGARLVAACETGGFDTEEFVAAAAAVHAEIKAEAR